MKIIAFRKIENRIINYSNDQLISCDICWESCGILDTKLIEVPVKSTEYTLEELQSIADKGLYRIAGYDNRYTTRINRVISMEVKSVKKENNRFIKCEVYIDAFDKYETVYFEIPDKKIRYTVDKVQNLINSGITSMSLKNTYAFNSL